MLRMCLIIAAVIMSVGFGYATIATVDNSNTVAEKTLRTRNSGTIYAETKQKRWQGPDRKTQTARLIPCDA